MNEGEKVIKNYLDSSHDLTNPNFKLCGQSKTDIEKCKRVIPKKRPGRSKKQKTATKKSTRSIQTSPVIFLNKQQSADKNINDVSTAMKSSERNSNKYSAYNGHDSRSMEINNNKSASSSFASNNKLSSNVDKTIRKTIRRRKNPKRKTRAPLKPSRKQPRRQVKKNVKYI